MLSFNAICVDSVAQTSQHGSTGTVAPSSDAWNEEPVDPMLYLNQVLNEIKKESNPPKALRAEHLFKLNEAVFNLSEEDAVDGPLAVRLFQVVERIHTSYNTGKYDNTDSNFFYDYLALLGTMQNQHFFSTKQTEKMLGWIKEVVDTSGMLAAAPSAGSKSLEAENEQLRKKLAKLEGAVQAIRAIETEPKAKKTKAKEEPAAKASPGKKGKGKGKFDDYEEEEPVKGKGKGKSKAKKEEKIEPKGKAKSKGKGEVKEEPKGKGKSKGKKETPKPEPKGKGKGKGKVKEEYEEPPSKGKSKGKGKGKSKEEEPPLRKGKGKGKAEEPKGKAKGKGKKGWKAK